MDLIAECTGRPWIWRLGGWIRGWEIGSSFPDCGTGSGCGSVTLASGGGSKPRSSPSMGSGLDGPMDGLVGSVHGYFILFYLSWRAFE